MFKNVKANEVLISICLFAIGLCLLMWADKVTSTFSLILGLLLVLYAIYNGIVYFKSIEKNALVMLSAVIFLVIGIILISRPSIIGEIISFVAGIYILLSSISNLSITLNNKGHKNYNIGLILSIAGILLGVLCILGKIIIPDLILRYLGVMLMIYSVIDIVNLCTNSNKIIKK